ncbi:YgjV family protein [Pseudoalteromonas shioyasakiensis]|uniref:YgjV family protein n=1 Tax=Pseudoalteromonas shioyasakiensis TaxID=1190813 RepID=UPI0020961C38|nr:YgjV family protein [Pseudoalteromonas shioyasakiensis]MCO6357065.1 YgjV family protein [Pseudoalteromonas shioyasakiensis]
MFILSQCLVAIATILDLASFQFKQRQAILACLFSSVLLTSVHFMLLDNFSAASLMLIAALRYGYCIFARKSWVMIAFMLLSISAVLFTWQSWVSFIALSATLLQTYASFQGKDFTLRILMIVGTIGWVAHNALVFSPLAVVMETVFLVSNLVGLWRFYVHPKPA